MHFNFTCRFSILVIAVLSLSSPRQVNAVSPDEIKYTLVTDSVYTDNTRIVIKFQLVNDTPKNLNVLTWGTLLEPFAGPILTVVCNGQELQYGGAMVKRGQPTAKDILLLQSGKTLERNGINLAEVYSFPQQGSCAVDLLPDYLKRSVTVTDSKDTEITISGHAARFEITTSRGGR
jgi:hypothetical protein